MKSQRVLLIASVVLLTLVLAPNGAGAQGPTGTQPRAPRAALGTRFTYQGQLKNSGSVVNGSCDFQFGLWDDASVGAQHGVTQTLTAVSVTSGLFTTPIDFGASMFDGNRRWLAIAVRCPTATGSYTALTTRQELTATPYALYATNGPFWSLTGNSGTNASTNFLGTTDNVTLTLRANNVVGWRLAPSGTNTPNVIGGYSGNSVTSGVQGATIGGGGVSGNTNRVTDDYGTVGGGTYNQAGDNAGSTGDMTFATVGGGTGNTASGGYATVAGGNQNTASGTGAFVGGGGYDGANFLGNRASGDASMIGGGNWNTAINPYDTVGGGYKNTASGGDSTIGGGTFNTASWQYATVGGGTGNTAGNYYTTVGGGTNNTASGYYATVPGGLDNSATMSYTLAAGRRAKANNDGAFVWADSTNADFSSTANNQFLIRASGGVGIATNSPHDALEVNGIVRVDVLGAAGSQALCRNALNQISTCASSLRYKNNVANLNLGLDAIGQLRPVTFNWKDSGQADLGFVAEEVNQVTPLLTTLNAQGQIEGVKYDRITAVLVKGMQEQQQQIADLKAQNASLEARVTALEHATGTAKSPTDWLNNGWMIGALLIAVVWVGRNRRGGAR